MLLYQTIAFTVHGNIKKPFKNNKFKVWAPTSNE